MKGSTRYLTHTPHKWNAIIFTIVAALVVALCCSNVFAQSSSSGVNGVVADPSGAAVPGAKIALKNVDTNVERTTVSNGSGDYFFTNVPPARYTLTVSATAFSPETISAFEIGVAQVVTINVSLKVGNVTQSVTVEAANTEVESSTAQLGTVINKTAVNSLPLNGRNFTQLLDLTPGVSPISTGQNATANRVAVVGGNGITDFAFPSINGASNRSTMYLVDGMNDINTWFNTYAVPPIIDTIDEFKINSHNDSAQYGGVTGGVVNIATKAGTNSYHGSAWEFVRTNSLDALPYFVAPSSYHLNTFGSQVGGPVWVPKLYNGRNKTFFEVGFENSRFEQADPLDYHEPTAAELGESTWGAAPNLSYMDFSSAQTGAAGNCVATATTASTGACQLYDPTKANFAATPARPAYLGNQISISELSPESLAYIQAVFKTAPMVIPGIAPTVDNGQTTIPEGQKTYNYTGRIDEHIGDKDFIFARYAAMEYYDTAPLAVPTLTSITDFPSQQYGVSWTHEFGPGASVQVQYDRAHVGANVDNSFSNSPNAIWQVFGCSTNLCNDYVAGAALMPTITITGGFSGGEENDPFFSLASTHEWSGIFSKTIGSHLLQAGGGWDETNYTADQQNATLTYSGAASGNFTNNPDSALGATASKQSGNGLADFLLDYPDTVLQRNVAIAERRGGIGSIFLQDSWKVNTRLTVNYGLRYDRGVIPPYGTEADQTLNGSIDTGDFDFTDGQYILQQLPKLCSVLGHSPCLPSATLPADVVVATGAKILHGTKADLGPRLGLAYRVNNNLSVRAGFGIVYDNWAVITQASQNYQGSWPDTGTLDISSPNLPVANGVYISGQNPFAANAGSLPAATPFGASNAGNFYESPYLKDPYSEQYNVGIEQALGSNSILALNYVGSATHRLDSGGYYNTGTLCGTCTSFAARQSAGDTGQPYPYAYPVKGWDHNAASGSYNSLQAVLRGHNGTSLSYMASYTWSKTLDEGGDGYFGAEGGVPEDPYNPRGSRGPAGYNIPQMFVLDGEYAIPVGSRNAFSTGNKVSDYVLGNWQINGILTGRSGKNFNVLSGGDIGETGNSGTYERANLVGNPYQSGPIAANPTCTPPAGPTRTTQQWFNPCAFETPADGTLGDAPRNLMQAQNFWNLDASLFRIFPIHESFQMKLDFEAFNALNHPVFAAPAATTTTTSTFGVITGLQNKNRILQIAVEAQF